MVPKRRKSTGIEPYRRGLDATGDIQVGAYARRQRRRRILLSLLGLALIGGAVGLYAGLRHWVLQPAAETRGRPYAVKVRCISCGYSATLDVSSGQTFPLECPVCGERGCKQLWKCRACGHEFLPAESGNEKRCPRCGNSAVGSAVVP